jgi:hypothetical protein
MRKNMKKNLSYFDILNIITDKNVEVRHDVDISLDSSFRMAKMEKENNLKSIYYIRFDSDYYNPLSLKNKSIINFLIENHEIGCHVDVTNINNQKELINYLDFYNNILSFNKFTFHINTEKTKSFGFLDKYENKSIITNGYISDSKNSFTNEDFSKLIELDNYTLLIHPEWWDNEDFIFGNESSKKLLLNSLRFEEIYNKSLKEILNIDKNE